MSLFGEEPLAKNDLQGTSRKGIVWYPVAVDVGDGHARCRTAKLEVFGAQETSLSITLRDDDGIQESIARGFLDGHEEMNVQASVAVGIRECHG
ncbi:MAG: hypothetical protein NTU88_13190 [Armatimonadetes bacterium]|nr:hypothetical protein [Armatimonadota bacterium]